MLLLGLGTLAFVLLLNISLVVEIGGIVVLGGLGGLARQLVTGRYGHWAVHLGAALSGAAAVAASLLLPFGFLPWMRL
ncbi:hypothetical protein [Peterkaempfera griseoplana]|uniref:hypothetical protein n=1 Tax=Peterkaempfera griseoplana TaxID=66896 RepID=UPI0006E3807C|nr:hypothetical protein [Peterkaempfera griseoplana]